jgi:hypothetical protein
MRPENSPSGRRAAELRRDVLTVKDVLSPSFEVAVELGHDDALALDDELLTTALVVRLRRWLVADHTPTTRQCQVQQRSATFDC